MRVTDKGWQHAAQGRFSAAAAVFLAASLFGSGLGLAAEPAAAARPSRAAMPLLPLLKLDRPMRGQEALDALGDRLWIAAARHRISTERLRDILSRDRTAWLDRDARLFYVENKAPQAAGTAAAAPIAQQAPFPLSQTFLLHSKPDSTHVIYLDFNGHVVTGTAWNQGGPSTINAPAYDTDGNPGSFSDEERETIQLTWQHVANDFAPFDVDVTTEEPPAAAIARTNAADQSYGTRAVITDDTAGLCDCGGFAYQDVFDITGSDHDYYQPAFVFNQNDAKVIGETVSHEVGHNLSLSHDGRTLIEDYYEGHGSGATGWGPIMGAVFDRELSQWSKGEYPQANNTEDDLAMIATAGTPYRADDFPATFAGGYGNLATLDGDVVSGDLVVDQTGLVERNTDSDDFAFVSGGGSLSLGVEPQTAPGVNLDVVASLYNSAGNLITTANDLAGIGATISTTVAAGNYFLRVAGTGDSSPSPGYSNYGSLGHYRITGSIPVPGGNDGVPDSYSFTAQTNVQRNIPLNSNSIVVSGIDQGTPISVTGGSYSINNGAFVTTAGEVFNGDAVRVQHTTANANNSSVTTTLNIGGVMGSFMSTTGDGTVNAFSFTSQTNVGRVKQITSNTITVSGITAPVAISTTSGRYSVNGAAFTTTPGTVVNGNTVRLQHMSASADNTTVTTRLNLGGITGNFSSTTGDNTPDSFSFAAQNNVARGITLSSNTITVSGLGLPVPLSVSGGKVSINGGAFNGNGGTVTNGNTVRLQHVSSAANNTSTTTTVNIGGASANFVSTTGDSTPNNFTFTAQTNVDRNVQLTSNSVTVGGTTMPVAISVSGGKYSINGGAFTASAATVSNGNTVRVQHNSSTANNSSVTTTLTMGGVSAGFTSTTADTVPDSFGFAPATGVAKGSTQTSAGATITGISKPVTISVTSGRYSINGGPFVTSAGTLNAGNTVRLQHTASASGSTTVTTTVTIGGMARGFSSTTMP